MLRHVALIYEAIGQVRDSIAAKLSELGWETHLLDPNLESMHNAHADLWAVVLSATGDASGMLSDLLNASATASLLAVGSAALIATCTVEATCSAKPPSVTVTNNSSFTTKVVSVNLESTFTGLSKLKNLKNPESIRQAFNRAVSKKMLSAGQSFTLTAKHSLGQNEFFSATVEAISPSAASTGQVQFTSATAGCPTSTYRHCRRAVALEAPPVAVLEGCSQVCHKLVMVVWRGTYEPLLLLI